MKTGKARADLYRTATRAAKVGLAVNLGLAAVKLAGGLAGRSFALLSDAVNSLGDVFTSLVVLFALHIAQQPADEEHPYGHTRAEAIAGSNVAVLILVSAALVAWQAALSLARGGAPAPEFWTIWIAGGNVVLKEALYQYKIRVGKRLGSASLIANAWDHRSDALSALAVLVGLLLANLAGPRFAVADQIAALFVAAAIAWSGIGLLRGTAHELMDRQADDPLVRKVRDAALEAPGVAGVDKLWIRKSGLEYLVDIHIEVEPWLTVAEGHRIGHEVKDDLLRRFPNLRDVLVHLEPSPPSR